MKVSVIIPVYNEEKVIKDCLNSLSDQTYKDLEIIVVDDGSTDDTNRIVKNLQFTIYNLQLLTQKHKGPGEARNLGAKEALGDILVFVDSDMTFETNFVEKLTKPIREGKTIGTFSKEEFVLNKDNIWSKCWNINKGLPVDKMHWENYPDKQPVFRAILKKEFDKADGFSPIGYIDDYTLSEKLGVLATVAPGAKFYHKNPQNLLEIFKQSRWIGKSEYKRKKVKNENLMRLFALIRFSLLFSLIHGIYGTIKYCLPRYLIFKIIYDLGIEISLVGSFFGEQPNK